MYRLSPNLTLPANAVAGFWARVDKENGPIHPTLGRCWVWTGGKRNGYGTMIIARRTVYAHRVSFVLHRGEMPLGKKVCHRCDTPPCVRDEHFFLGTQADNIGDMRMKGRGSRPPVRRGLDNARAVLTDDEVAEIRRLRATRELDQRATARRFGVSPSTVWRFVHGVTRKVG